MPMGSSGWSSGEVERVLQRAQAVVEGAEGVLVGLARVRDGGQVHDGRGLDVGEHARERVVVARVHGVHVDLRAAQQVQALVEHLEVQLAVDVLGVRREGEQVVDLQAVDDLDGGAAGEQVQREVVSDEAAAADERDLLALQVLERAHWSTSAAARRTMSATSFMSAAVRCVPLGSATPRSLISAAPGYFLAS
jgi:hypothetical protein